MPIFELPPTLTEEDGAAVTDELCLLVIADDQVLRHPLPRRGSVRLGRAPECDFRVDDPSISREHAAIHLGATIEIEDLGSANGCWIRGKRIESNQRETVQAGQVVELGSTMVIVQQASLRATPRKLWTHGYFELHLEQACSRAKLSGVDFAVLRLHVDGAPPVNVVRAALIDKLRSADLLALYAPGEYELYLADADASRVASVVGRIADELVEHGVELEYGAALFGVHGRTPEDLIAYACAEVRGSDADAAEEQILEDEGMRDLHRVVLRVARGSLSVLLLGETGVGKELFAETVHSGSPRRDAPFVRLNCAALSETLLESELFGHEKGAFTGADVSKPGLLEAADEGTVFLDEIGELPLSLQAKLLRVIEQREVLRVGGLKPQSVDVRFVSATNRDLETEVAAGRFRKDLYYRLNGVAIMIPPLRDRVAEIEPLAESFVARACREMDFDVVPRISERGLDLLKAYEWPGNIRELKNAIERAVLLATGDVIDVEHLPMDKLTTRWESQRAGSRVATPLPRSEPPRGRSWPPADVSDLSEEDRLRREQIMDALERCHGNQTKAAGLLGVSRRTLSTWLDKYRIARPRKGTAR